MKKSLVMVMMSFSIFSTSVMAQTASAPAAEVQKSEMDLGKAKASDLPNDMAFNILMSSVPMYFQGQIGQNEHEEKRLVELATHVLSLQETPDVVRAHAYGILAFERQCKAKNEAKQSLSQIYKLVDSDKTLTTKEKKETKNAFFKIVNAKKCGKK